MGALLVVLAAVAGTLALAICGLLIVANPDRTEEEAELAALDALRRFPPAASGVGLVQS